MTAGTFVFIFAIVKPSLVLKEEFESSKNERVVNVFELAFGAVLDAVSLNHWDALILTLNTVAPPLVNPPSPKSSESAEELMIELPPLLESKSIE